MFVTNLILLNRILKNEVRSFEINPLNKNRRKIIEFSTHNVENFLELREKQRSVIL